MQLNLCAFKLFSDNKPPHYISSQIRLRQFSKVDGKQIYGENRESFQLLNDFVIKLLRRLISYSKSASGESEKKNNVVQ